MDMFVRLLEQLEAAGVEPNEAIISTTQGLRGRVICITVDRNDVSVMPRLAEIARQRGYGPTFEDLGSQIIIPLDN